MILCTLCTTVNEIMQAATTGNHFWGLILRTLLIPI